ncbi:bifunctional DNA primase/polymerase [Gandjariella thermophila]|uniref:DNA primase/polymerase bifunctional N-terminal domain-containing protein n=1 Tax=Gandjariella thermophila TaxID=1931992 RepID=A0A4D4JDI1_9PSEU|nr:bifunctional DNA primase/polymerase [Gandjariella thermophila]GDY31943.1 hypothetical protein GTS_35760 [Gandjariella thermophila]
MGLLSGWYRRWELRRSVLDYVGHGWPVVPATYYNGRRYVCVRADCAEDGPHPVWRAWRERATTDPATVRSWYRLCEFGVAVLTGARFDVLEVPEPWGERVQTLLATGGSAGPAAVYPERGRRLFWVARGLRLDDDLAAAGFRVRGEGGWALAPPSRTRGGPVRWTVPPERVSWRPAHLSAVREALDVAAARASTSP